VVLGRAGRQYAGKIIVAGAKNAHVPARMGWDRADSLTEAISMARSFVGPSASITLMKWPPIVMADVRVGWQIGKSADRQIG